ncbi:hypothetical protein EOM82_05560 [bacterium]|nr:hypothetical protein [bacterium]
MKLLKKYRKLIIMITILILLATYSAILATREYGDFRLVRFKISEISKPQDPIYIRVGEAYNMEDFFAEATAVLGKKTLNKMDWEFSLSTSENSILDVKNKSVIGSSCGLATAYCNFDYLAYYRPDRISSNAEIEFLNIYEIYFIVLPEESEYVEVYSISDLTSENKTFVLKSDITISDDYLGYYALKAFNGVFLNPDGYSITIEESSGLTSLIEYNYGLLEGIKLNARINFHNYDLSICGLTIYNEGLIKDCELEADIEMVKGRISLNNIYGSTLSCSYNITAFGSLGYNYGYSYKNLNESNIQFTFSGNTANIEGEDCILPVNTVYKQILE